MDLKELLRTILRDIDLAETAELAAREEVRSQGCRLVRHDQVKNKLEVRDAVTNELLFLGTFDEGSKLYDENGWADTDSINMSVDERLTILRDIPEDLQMRIREWVEMNVQEARNLVED